MILHYRINKTFQILTSWDKTSERSVQILLFVIEVPYIFQLVF